MSAMGAALFFALLLSVASQHAWTAPAASSAITCETSGGDDEDGVTVTCFSDSKSGTIQNLAQAVNSLTLYNANASDDVHVNAGDVRSLSYTGDLAEIPDNAFSAFKTLRDLSIRGLIPVSNDGSSVNPPPVNLKANAFKGLENTLQRLEFVGVNLASAGGFPAAIRPLANLEVLRFDDCSLKGQVKGQDLKQLSKLHQFEISNSPDLSIADDAFSGNADSLEKLIFSQVQAKTIPKSVSSLKSLLEFQLQNSGITTLSAVFQSSLKELRLSDNAIASIDAGAFKGLSALTVLVLSQNQISSLPAGLFDDLTSLETLELNGNQLTTATTEKAFTKLKSLKQLGLGGNQLDSVTAGMLAGIESSVTSLYLSGNKIKTVKGTSKLTQSPSLSLSSNGIDALTSDTIESGSTFSELQLDSNPIASIQSGSFKNIDVGPSFAIDDTAMTEIDLSSLSGIKRIENLTISNNADLRTLKVSSDSAVPSTLKNIIFTNNAKFVPTDADGKLAAYLKKSGVRLIFTDKVFCHCQLGWLGSKWPKNAGDRKNVVIFAATTDFSEEQTPTPCCNLDDTTVEDFLSDKVFSQKCSKDKADALTDTDTC